MERSRAAWWVGVVMSVVLVPACSANDAPVAEIDAVEQAGDPDDAGEVFIEITESTDDRDSTGSTDTAVVTAADDDGQPVIESLPPVPETGVPGIESDDAFCRSWSTYAGSVSAIFAAWGLQPSADAARLEVVATSVLSRSVTGMADALPSEIEPNRQSLTVDVPAPLLRRADRAATLLIEAGLDYDEINALGEAWVAAITEQGVDSETLTVEVPPDLSGALDEAAEAFAAELPPTFEDPTLNTEQFDITPTIDYTVANCPDQGTLAGNDVIDAEGV